MKALKSAQHLALWASALTSHRFLNMRESVTEEAMWRFGRSSATEEDLELRFLLSTYDNRISQVIRQLFCFVKAHKILLFPGLKDDHETNRLKSGLG